MAKVGCPGCKKVYNVPDSAAGQVATCKCGKKFRLGKKREAAAVATATKPRPQTKSQAKPRAKATSNEAAVAAPAGNPPSDSFWDEALAEPTPAPSAMIATPSGATLAAGASAATHPALVDDKPKKKKKKKRKSGGVRWGADWGKVAGGGVAFLGGGAGCVALWLAGYINIWLVLVTIGGFFTMLTGLMGEEGVW